MRIILASESQYKKHALDVLGLTYEVCPSYFDEASLVHEDPGERAKLLAEAKAKAIGEKEEGIIIASDLFLVMDGKNYEKPKDLAEAKAMLQSFSGRTFSLISGLAVYASTEDTLLSAKETCQVRFRVLADAEIDDYIQRYPVLKCSAAFEADGLLRFAEHIEGSYTFRAGMPVDKLATFLNVLGAYP